MGSVVIRNLDDAIINQFRTKAELREALAEKVAAMSPPRAEDSTHLIRQDRDSR
jgi:antitoxin FitA